MGAVQICIILDSFAGLDLCYRDTALCYRDTALCYRDTAQHEKNERLGCTYVIEYITYIVIYLSDV